MVVIKLGCVSETEKTLFQLVASPTLVDLDDSAGAHSTDIV